MNQSVSPPRRSQSPARPAVVASALPWRAPQGAGNGEQPSKRTQGLKCGSRSGAARLRRCPEQPQPVGRSVRTGDENYVATFAGASLRNHGPWASRQLAKLYRSLSFLRNIQYAAFHPAGEGRPRARRVVSVKRSIPTRLFVPFVQRPVLGQGGRGANAPRHFPPRIWGGRGRLPTLVTPEPAPGHAPGKAPPRAVLTAPPKKD